MLTQEKKSIFTFIMQVVSTNSTHLYEYVLDIWIAEQGKNYKKNLMQYKNITDMRWSHNSPDR